MISGKPVSGYYPEKPKSPAELAAEAEQARLQQQAFEREAAAAAERTLQQQYQQQQAQQQYALQQQQTNYNTGTSYAPEYTSGAHNAAQATLGAPAYEQQQQTQLEFDLSQRAFRNRLGAIKGLIGSSNGGGPEVQYDPTGEEESARQAAFASAKEQAGLLGNSALMSLKGLYENSGMMGSTAEAAGQGRAVGGAQAEVGEFLRGQLQDDLASAKRKAEVKYQGGIQQRGQNVSALSALTSLAY